MAARLRQGVSLLGWALFFAGSVGWTGWFLASAVRRWSYQHWYAHSFGPFIRLEALAQHLHATDWRTPLLVATLPLSVLGVWCLLKRIGRRLRRPRAGGDARHFQ